MSDYKTNVMRMLDKAKISYKHYTYADTDAISGVEVGTVLNQNPDRVFKTLVTVAKSGIHYVFMIRVGEKSVEMLKSKELLSLTGYIHGGCSPIGMKKFFRTVVDSSALNFDTIMFSAGKIGYQVELAPKDLEKVIRVEFGEIAV